MRLPNASLTGMLIETSHRWPPQELDMQVIGNQRGQRLEFLTSWLRRGGGLFASKMLHRTRRERCRCNPGVWVAGSLGSCR